MKQRVEEINGVEYTFQSVGVRHSVKMRDAAKNKHGVLNEENYYDQLLKHVIVNPKVDWSYFDERPEDFDEVMKVAAEVANNKTPSNQE